jgi:hypothetical protein
MGRNQPKPASQWLETVAAAAELGLTPSQLLTLRVSLPLQAGKHYRVKNPQASTQGRRYLFNPNTIADLLNPLD